MFSPVTQETAKIGQILFNRTGRGSLRREEIRLVSPFLSEEFDGFDEVFFFLDEKGIELNGLIAMLEQKGQTGDRLLDAGL